MFADVWVISQIVGQLSALVLIIIATYHSAHIINAWSPGSNSELQISLERKSYLISTVIQYVLIFQIISLFVYLITVNNYLPGLIKGAMCAQGTLTVNTYGYPLLFIKITAVIFYTTFLFVNNLDDAEPEYPLTPKKFWLIFPIFLVIVVDSIYLLLYFANISPDIIATCCSISFSLTDRVAEGNIFGGQWVDPAILSFYLLSLFLIINLLIKKNWNLLSLALGIILIPIAVYVLKYHFVKFIYALPSHNCLFDIFWKDYYYIGYVLFGVLIVLLLVLIMMNLYRFVQAKLNKRHDILIQRLRIIAITCVLFFMIINSGYWIYWRIFRI